MRKIVAVLLTAALVVAAPAGCGADKPKAKAFEGTIVLGFAQTGAESGWRIANTRSIQESAKRNNVRLLFDEADGKQINQIAAIRSYIARKVDVIAFAPVVENGWDQVLREAKQAGIPVIVTDRSIKTADTSLYTASLGSDFISEGNRAALWLEQEYQNKPGPVRIVEMRGSQDSAPAVLRRTGFAEVLAKESKFKIIDSATGDWTRPDGKRLMKKFLKKDTDINVLFAHNDDMGLGAAESIKEAGKAPGTDIKIITVDATKDGLDALIAGRLNFVVECNPLIGPQLMDLVVDLYLGGHVDNQTWTEETVFTKAAAEEALPERQY